jgi:hypothetical protein
MPEGQMPPQGSPAPEQPAEGGGAQEALNSLGEGLSTIVEAMGQDPAIPDEAKQAFQASLEAYKAGMQAMSGGGAVPEQGVSTPEQGASGAVPESMGRRG